MEIAHRNDRSQSLQYVYRVYFLFKSERLSAKIKQTLHKQLINVVMTYAFSAWEFATDTHVIQFQSLQDRVLRNMGNFPRCPPVLQSFVCP
jgi:hypothetical protein